MQELTRAAAYWSNEVDRQLQIIESLAGRKHDLLSEVERIDIELGRERSVLEGLERIRIHIDSHRFDQKELDSSFEMLKLPKPKF